MNKRRNLKKVKTHVDEPPYSKYVPPDLVSLDTAVEKQADEARVAIDGCKVKR